MNATTRLLLALPALLLGACLVWFFARGGGSRPAPDSIPGQHEKQVREALERAALTCPVHKSLRPEVEIPVRFEWGAPAAARG